MAVQHLQIGMSCSGNIQNSKTGKFFENAAEAFET